jgi:hypothetical protein
VNLWEMGLQGVDLIQLAQDNNHLRALVDMGMNF